jgi:hypothetical protein
MKTVEQARRWWWYSSFGILGFHRHYLGDHLGGVLMLLTLGLYGLWAVLDYWRLPKLVEQANEREKRYRGEADEPGPPGPQLVAERVDDGIDPFPARYGGVCAVCDRPITEGEWIYAVPGRGAAHEWCGVEAGWVEGAA